MGLYGPFTAVSGTVQECDVDPNAQALYIINTSIYDLALAFLPTKPASTTLYGGGYWYYNVPSGDRRGVRIPFGVYGSAGFPGYLFVLPIDNTGSLALTGTKSANKIFTIESYADQATLPPDYASPQRQDISSQARVVDVPIAIPNATGSLTGIVNGNKQFITAAFVLSADCLANQVVYAYFHSWRIRQRDTASAASYSYQLEACVRNSGGTILQTTIFHFSSTDAGTTTAPSSSGIDEYFPARPTWFRIGLNALVSPFDLIVQFHCTGAGGTPNTSDYALQFSVDTTNGTVIGDIGNWPPAFVSSGTNPLLY